MQGALRHGNPSSGAAATRTQTALKPDQTASAAEQANKAAVRALDRSRRLPGARARKPQIRAQAGKAGKENSFKEAGDTSIAPPAALKRSHLQPSTAARYGLLAHHCI